MISVPLQQYQPDAAFQAALALAGVSRDPFRFIVEPTKEADTHVRGVTRDYLDVFSDIFGGELDNYGADPLTWVFSLSRSDTERESFQFHIQPPGSVVELLGLLLPGLLLRDFPTELVLEGATHAPGAYLPEQVAPSLAPLVEDVGGELDFTVERYGFPPRGRGRVTATVKPAAGGLRKPNWCERGYVRELEVSVILAHLQRHVGEREIETFAEELLADIPVGATLTELHAASSQGNAMVVEIRDSEHVETIGVLGEKGVRAEDIAWKALDKMAAYLGSRASLQSSTRFAALLAAAAGGGEFWTTEIDEETAVVGQYAPKFMDTHLNIRHEDAPTKRVEVYRSR